MKIGSPLVLLAALALAGCQQTPPHKGVVLRQRTPADTGPSADVHLPGGQGEPALKVDMEPTNPESDPLAVEPKVPPMFERTNLAQPERNDPNWIAAHDFVTRPQNLPISCDLPRGAYFRPKLFHGNKHEKLLALTFDDGPRPQYTPRLLKVLEKLDVQATFFVVGKMANKYPNLVKKIRAAGHVVANHSYSHPTLSRLSIEDIKTELVANNMLIEKITGKKPIFFRPPGGQVNADVIKAAEECGLITVFWTNDPGDYAQPGTKVLLDKTLEHIGPGGIIVFHDGPEETLDILPALVSICRDNGYHFVTMNEMLESLPEPKIPTKLTARSTTRKPEEEERAIRPEPN